VRRQFNRGGGVESRHVQVAEGRSAIGQSFSQSRVSVRPSPPSFDARGGVERHAVEHGSETPETTEMVNRYKDEAQLQSFPKIGGTTALTPRGHMRTAPVTQGSSEDCWVATSPLASSFSAGLRMGASVTRASLLDMGIGHPSPLFPLTPPCLWRLKP
jgi:hypothetical protein